jgi:hypothetical protein
MGRLNHPATLNDHTPVPSERRAAIRYAVGRDGTCRPALADDPQGVPAWWTDISTLGIGLIVEQPFELRTLLVVELNDKAGRPMRPRLARVRHVTAWGPNRWWLGCKLCSELTPNELKTMLAGGGRVR